MVDIPEHTAFLEHKSGGKHCISFTEFKIENKDTAYIKIPAPIAELDYLNIKEGKVGIYNDENSFVSLAAHNGDAPKAEIMEDEDGYWVSVRSDCMNAIQPLNDTKNMPVLFLSCGELWILNNHDLWDKLAAGFEG